MKLSRLPIGGKDRARCNGLTLMLPSPWGAEQIAAVVVMSFRNARFRAPRNRAVAITMSFHLFDLAGFIGVVLIIVAYLLLQLEKLPSSSARYSLLNAAGALLIIVSLIFAFNLAAFIVEVFWFLISLVGLWKALSRGKHSKPGDQWPQ